MAKIYKITSTAGEKVYIGSTIRTLEHRWSQHPGDCMSKVLFEEYGRETCSIHLIEEVKEDQCIERERWWIENTEYVVNQMVPGRTYKEWYMQNRERLIKKTADYYIQNRQRRLISLSRYREEHKDEREELLTTPIVCECGDISTKRNIARHRKSKKHLSKVKLSNE